MAPILGDKEFVDCPTQMMCNDRVAGFMDRRALDPGITYPLDVPLSQFVEPREVGLSRVDALHRSLHEEPVLGVRQAVYHITPPFSSPRYAPVLEQCGCAALP